LRILYYHLNLEALTIYYIITLIW